MDRFLDNWTLQDIVVGGLAGLGLVLGIAATFLFGYGDPVDRDDLEKIGQIDLSVKDVRRRHGASFKWHSVDKVTIYNKDAVFTGSSSEATVSLDSGPEVIVQENSLVIFDLSLSNGLELEIERGSLGSRLATGELVTVKASDKASFNVRAKESTRVSLSKTDSGIDLQVEAGEVEVMSGGKLVTAKVDQAVSLKPSGQLGPILDVYTVKDIVAESEPEVLEEASEESKPVSVTPKEAVSSPDRQVASEEPPEPSVEPLADPPETVNSAKLSPEAWVWVGTGVNYVNYSQSVDGTTDLDYENFKAPNIYFSGGGFSGSWGFEGSFKRAIGEIDNTSNGQSVIDYNWDTLSLEGLYRKGGRRLDGEYFEASQWTWRFGVQSHRMPFVDILSSLSNMVVVADNDLLNLSGGFNYFVTAKKWPLRFELMLRYQHTLSSNSELDVSPRFNFDGSVGGAYGLSDRLRLGVYWYGQLHNMDYTYSGQNMNMSGNQELFFSNIDFRLGFEF